MQNKTKENEIVKVGLNYRNVFDLIYIIKFLTDLTELLYLKYFRLKSWDSFYKSHHFQTSRELVERINYKLLSKIR